MIRLASVLLCALAFGQHSIGPGTTGGVALTTTAGGPVFPPGAAHAWKMEQAEGATRLDSVGSANMTESGAGDATQVTGKSGYGAGFPGGAGNVYLTTGLFNVGSAAFTIAAWGYVASGDHAVVGPWGSTPTIVISDNGTVGTYWWDPTTGNPSALYVETGASIASTWVLVVARFDQTNKTATMRLYGFAAGNKVTYNPSQLQWANSFSQINLEPANYNTTTTAGRTDEVTVWDRYLTDAECDVLPTLFYGT